MATSGLLDSKLTRDSLTFINSCFRLFSGGNFPILSQLITPSSSSPGANDTSTPSFSSRKSAILFDSVGFADSINVLLPIKTSLAASTDHDFGTRLFIDCFSSDASTGILLLNSGLKCSSGPGLIGHSFGLTTTSTNGLSECIENRSSATSIAAFSSVSNERFFATTTSCSVVLPLFGMRQRCAVTGVTSISEGALDIGWLSASDSSSDADATTMGLRLGLMYFLPRGTDTVAGVSRVSVSFSVCGRISTTGVSIAGNSSSD
eukprot:Gregarina_sp_Poly_1__10652@NODE_7_length_24424_cov_76_286365_g6_i0_p10_GENE_NODE_7_length_24424_cov_76_286365_g6_i0NODE_7_length_24424_cov_76_286365_g6_i0_p10_ORF_typecomplete_len262_score30_47_NODE_7_length_24424_cov_76_286365_g6_i062106995